MLSGLLAAAGRQRAQVAMVVGDAGIGKSRLIAEFLSRAVDPGDVVAVGHCMELFDTTLPFGPVIQALRSLEGRLGSERFRLAVGHAGVELRRLVPDIVPDADGSTGSMPDSAARLFDAVSQVLTRASAGGRLLLLVEDLHWADRATLDLLTYLARTLGEAPVLILSTIRQEALRRRGPLRSWMAELLRLDHVHQLDVDGLAGDDLAVLSAALAGEVAVEGLLELAERSEGNPFYLEELVAARTDGAGGFPERLRDFLVARLERLPREASVLVRAAAVAGAVVPHDLLRAVVDPPTILSPGLRSLLEEGILVPTQDAHVYRFRHALLREAVLAEMLTPERSELHGQLAAALEADPLLVPGGPQLLAPQLAAHWDGAGNRPKALATAVTAARVLTDMGVSAEATAYYERALVLWPTVPAPAVIVGVDEVQVRIEAARAYEGVGDLDRSASQLLAARDALSENDTSRRYELVTARLGWLMLGTGNPVGLELLDEVVERDGDRTALGWALAWRAQQNLLRTRFALAGPDAERAVEVAELIGDMRLLAHALVTLASVRGITTDLNVDAMFERARAVAESSGDYDLLIRAYGNHAHVLHSRDRNVESLRMERALLPLLERPMPLSHRIVHKGNIANGAVESGDFQLAASIYASVPDTRFATKEALTWRLMLAEFCSLVGKYQAAACHLLSAGTVWHADDPLITARIRIAEVRLSWATGDVMSVSELPMQAVPLMLDSDDQRWQEDFVMWAVRAQALAPPDTATRANTSSLLEHFNHLPRGSPRHLATMAEAAWVLTGPDPDLFASAACAFDLLPNVVDAGLCRVREAEAALASGDRARAWAVITAAYPAAEAMGFRLAVDLFLGLAARAGLKLLSTRLTAGSRYGLTPRECDVVGGLAQGQSNKEIAKSLFLGVRTIETHVSSILAKLGVTSRQAAAEIARAEGMINPPSP